MLLNHILTSRKTSRLYITHGTWLHESKCAYCPVRACLRMTAQLLLMLWR